MRARGRPSNSDLHQLEPTAAVQATLPAAQSGWDSVDVGWSELKQGEGGV